MIERILVPLDGSLTAEAILPQVRRVLYRNDSEVILVQAVVPPMVEYALPMAEAQVGAAREYIAGKLERLERAGVRAKSVVRIGLPVDVILDVAKEQQATLIALATHGDSGVKRLLFGSVAEGILRRSPVPVLLVRPFWSYELVPPVETALRPIRNLLLPVDGSDRSTLALPGVIEFAGLFETRVVLLRVLDVKPRDSEPGKDEREARSHLAAIAKTLELEGVEALSLIEKGEPAEQILKSVGLHEIDIIAMTTHGRTGLARVVTGSVAEKVLRQATVPLLAMRRVESPSPVEAPKTAKLEI